MNKDRRKKLKLLTRQQKNELEKLTAQCKAKDKTLSQTNAVLEKYFAEAKKKKMAYTDPRSQKIISDMQHVLTQFYDFIMQHSQYSGFDAHP